MRVFNFITRQKLQKWNLKNTKYGGYVKATSHLQSFYAMNTKAEMKRENVGEHSRHHLLCFGILCKLTDKRVCLCSLCWYKI